MKSNIENILGSPPIEQKLQVSLYQSLFDHVREPINGDVDILLHETCTLALRIWGIDLICRAGLRESSPTKLSGGTRIPPTLMHSRRRHLFTNATSPASVTWRQLHRMMLCTWEDTAHFEHRR
jgi:hypothetical protein